MRWRKHARAHAYLLEEGHQPALLVRLAVGVGLHPQELGAHDRDHPFLLDVIEQVLPAIVIQGGQSRGGIGVGRDHGRVGEPRARFTGALRTAQDGYQRNAAVETFEVHDGGGAVQPAIGRLRDNVLPGQGPKHVCVFLALGDADARDVWFFGHEEERSGENVAIAPGPRRDRGGRRRESDGIAAPARPAGVRRSRASRLRRLFRATTSGNPRLKTGATTKHTNGAKRRRGPTPSPSLRRAGTEFTEATEKSSHRAEGLSAALAPYAPPGGHAQSWPRRGAGGAKTRKTWETRNLVSVASVASCSTRPANRSKQRERRVRPFARMGVPSCLGAAWAV